MDILKKLFFGKISPFENFQPQNEEYDTIEQEYYRCEKQFYSQLDEDSKELFQKLSCLESQIELEKSSLYFCHGFKLGAQFLLAALEKDEFYFS